MYDEIRDLKGLATNLSNPTLVKDKKVRAAAAAVAEAVDSAVVDNLAHAYKRLEVKGEGLTVDGKEKFVDYRMYEGQYDAHGLSLFAPTSEKLLKSPKMTEYKGLTMVAESGWGEYLMELQQQVKQNLEKQGDIVARPADPEVH
jgi:hypothetical protein